MRNVICSARLKNLLVGLVLGGVASGAIPGTALAQRTYDVRGRVLTPDGQAISVADVQVLSAGREAFTGPSGRFDLGSLASGTYKLRVRRIGFESVTLTIAVPSSEPELTVTLTPVPVSLDTVRTNGLAQDLPRVFERAQQHLGALILGSELVKQHPGLSADEILQTDSALWPFMRSASERGCGMQVFINGKPLPRPMLPASRMTAVHTIVPDMHIREYVRMEDIAAVEVFREANGKIYEPWIRPSAGETCGPLVLIWTKGYKQSPYNP